MKIEESKEYLGYLAERKEKGKTLLWGDDIVHLTYLAPIIDKETLEILKTELKNVNLRLSSWDDFGVIKATFEDYSLQVYLAISNPVTLEILKTIGLNIIWETIKTSTLKIHKKIFRPKDDQISNISSNINFGIKLKVDDKVTFEFKLDGNLNDALVLESMDKALDFIKENYGKSTLANQHQIFSVLDRKNKKWNKIDIMKEVKRKIKK